MGLLNTLIDKNPFPLLVPFHNYCGPGNPLSQQLAADVKPYNQIDNHCKAHDIFYAQNKSLSARHEADKVLASQALKRVTAKDSSLYEKLVSGAIAAAMTGKVKIGAGFAPHHFLNSGRFRTTSKRGEGRRRKTRRGRRGGRKRSQKGVFLPLAALMTAIPAITSLVSGASSVIKNWKDVQNSKNALAETIRHNKALEGRGVGLKRHRRRRRRIRSKAILKRQPARKTGRGAILKQWRQC